MWDKARTAIEDKGFLALDRYLDTRVVDALTDEFAEAKSSVGADVTSGVIVKRGVVLARRNLLSVPSIIQFIAAAPVQSLIESLCPGSVAVRAILFDKTGSANWTVPWHQDRSIAVRERREVAGFGPWSEKAGIVHVQPPVAILRSMLTLRFSLDDCDEDNGPLRVIGGTHEVLLTQQEIDAAVHRGAQILCTTGRGGVVIMRPLLLHASSPARRVRHRRVLHIEFGPSTLPGGLAWAMA